MNKYLVPFCNAVKIALELDTCGIIRLEQEDDDFDDSRKMILTHLLAIFQTCKLKFEIEEDEKWVTVDLTGPCDTLESIFTKEKIVYENQLSEPLNMNYRGFTLKALVVKQTYASITIGKSNNQLLLGDTVKFVQDENGITFSRSGNIIPKEEVINVVNSFLERLKEN